MRPHQRRAIAVAASAQAEHARAFMLGTAGLVIVLALVLLLTSGGG